MLKAFVAAALLFCVPLQASEIQKPRNFIKATLSDALELGLAPTRWKAREWGYLGAGALGLLAVTQSDTLIYPRLRGKEDWLDVSMPVVTHMGDGLYGFAAPLVLWGLAEIVENDRLADSSATALEAMVFCGILSPAFKYAFSANRPSDRDDRHDFFTAGVGGSPSFPSGHTMVAFALAEVYGKAYGRCWTYPVAALVGYSRIYLGVHWPSDVAAGAVLGALLGNFAATAAEKQGSPRSWSFTIFPADSGKTMLVAQKVY